MSGVVLKCSARVELDGFDDFLADLQNRLDSGLEEVADEVVEEAKRSTAFRDRTGKLRNTIRKYHDSLGVWYVRAGGTAKVKHAHLVEFSHAIVTRDGRTLGQVMGHPFLRPAAEKVVGQAVDIVAKGMEKEGARPTVGIGVEVG